MSSAAPKSEQATPATPSMAPPAALPPPFATLAAELRLHASDRAQDFGPIAVIQALILALLARLLGQLDGMFQRWQQGQLPPPTPARPRTRTTPAASPRPKAPSESAWNPFTWDDPRPARPSSRQAAPEASQAPGIHARPSRQISIRHLHAQATVMPRVCAPAATPAPPIPSRDIFQKPAHPAGPSHALFVTI